MMLVMQDDCAMRPIRVRNNHALARRKQSRSCAKNSESQAESRRGGGDVCRSDTGHDLRSLCIEYRIYDL